MMIKVAVSDCFKLKMIPSFRSVFFPEKQEIHYIGGTDILPLPLSSEEEGHAISLLGGGQDEATFCRRRLIPKMSIRR